MANYAVLFILLLANLFGYVGILSVLPFDTVVVQIFVVFAYLLISAIVLWGVGNARRWGAASAAVLFFAQATNAGIVYQFAIERAAVSVWIVLIASVLGFIYSVRRAAEREPTNRPVEPIVVESYDGEQQLKKKSTRKRTSKKQASKKKRTAKRTAKKKASKRKSSKGKSKKTSKKRS